MRSSLGKSVPISYFAGYTVLITGASAGIGCEFARQLAPVARKMILVARRTDRLEALESELKVINPGLELFGRSLDLPNQAQLKLLSTCPAETVLTLHLLITTS